MEFRILKWGIALFFGCILSIACNNSNKSENNSTTATELPGGNYYDTSTYVNSSDSINRNQNAISDSANRTKTIPNAPGLKRKPVISTKLPAARANEKVSTDKDGYYLNTETMPAYPGGQHALETYISNNLEYPEDALDNSVEGTVYVQFAIDESGNVTRSSVIGSKLGYGLDEAAVGAISSMPKWTPGKVKGRNVKAWYTIPVTYKLE
jgi:periplasmic protein TonB